MCGLAGVLSPTIAPVDYDIFRDLMIVSMIRGFQGAGAVFVNRKEATPIRTLSNGAALATSKLFDNQRSRQNMAAFGHCRWPTRGYINVMEHVHPHQFGDILAVHNGTMTSVMGEAIPKEESDSSLLIEAIARFGIKKAIQESKGAYALTWVDMKTKTLHFLRNWERPLHFATFENDDTLYWASEPRFLDAVLSRRSDKKLTITNLPIDKHVVYDLMSKDPPKPVEVEEISRPLATSTGWKGGGDNKYYGHMWADDYDDAYGKGNTDIPWFKNTPKLPPPKAEKESIQEGEYHRIFNNYWASEETITEHLQEGCVGCGAPGDFRAFMGGTLEFVSPSAFVCDSCVNDEDIHTVVRAQYALPDSWPYLYSEDKE